MKGEHKTPEFLAINPQGVVPAIKESKDGDDFILGESHTILRYLAESRGTDDKWYPKDLRKRARVDEYLDSHHGDLRNAVTGYISRKLFAPGTSEEELKVYLDKQAVVFPKLEKRLESQDYLCGAEVSLADLSAA